MLGGVGVFFFLWLYTIVAFAAINVAMFTLYPTSYSTQGQISFFTFFHYSFYTYVHAGISELVATSPLTQGVAMLEACLALVTVALFAGAIIITLGERYSTQLDDLIDNAERESRYAEGFIRDEFGFSSIDEAIAELQRLKSSMVAFLLMLTQNLD